MSNVLFKYGTQSMFDSIENKNSNALYFIEDTHRLYRGSTLIASSDVELITALPDSAAAQSGKLYVLASNNYVSIYVKDGSSMKQISGQIPDGSIDDINMFGDLLVKSDQTLVADDAHIATTQTINNAIQTIQSSISKDFKSAIVDVSSRKNADNSSTILTFTDKSGTSKNITINDLFLNSASYDSTTHVLSLGVSGQSDPVDVDLSQLVPQVVNASQVALARNITATVDVGNVKKGDKLSVESISDVQKLFEKLLSKDSNPITTQPSAQITLANAGAKEVGVSFVPQYTATLNAGKYSDNADGPQPTGVTPTSYAITDTLNSTSTTATGKFAQFTVTDSTNYRITAKIRHTAGNVPTTFLGEAYPSGQIKADNAGKSAASASVTGYRQGFYGTLTSKSGAVNSALVRGLTNKSNKKVAKGQKYTLSIPAGTMRIVIAYEASVGSIASITSDEQFGSEIKDSFALSVVSVFDASGSNGKNYNVYVKDLATAQATGTKYQITI